MDVVFIRTGERSYAIEVQRAGQPVMRMDPAPGFDPHFPHDLQHLIVEEQLGLGDGIFGRLARGGTASTFHATPPAGARPNKRDAARLRRRLQRRDSRLADQKANDFARSERATYVAWHDWLSHRCEPELRRKAREMRATSQAILDRIDQEERAALTRALPALRVRIDEVSRSWAALSIGDEMTIGWRQK